MRRPHLPEHVCSSSYLAIQSKRFAEITNIKPVALSTWDDRYVDFGVRGLWEEKEGISMIRRALLGMWGDIGGMRIQVEQPATVESANRNVGSLDANEVQKFYE